MDALAVLPPPMREALTPHVSVILTGLVERDVRRVVSHKVLIALWHRLLGRPASEPGRLCHRDGGHDEGARRRRALVFALGPSLLNGSARGRRRTSGRVSSL